MKDGLRSKSRVVVFRMTQPQYIAVWEAAKAEGVSVSELIRAVVIERTRVSLLAENQRLRSELEAFREALSRPTPTPVHLGEFSDGSLA